MSVASTFSRAQVGVDAPLVTVEADISSGLPQLVIVGLPETAVRESKDRVKAALMNAGFRLPSRRVTINLAPADLPKQGGRYDLAIALCVLAASDQIDPTLISNREFLGELSLGGKLRGVSGALPAILQSKQQGRQMIVPRANQAEAALAGINDVCASLSEAIEHLRGNCSASVTQLPEPEAHPCPETIDDIRGQYLAKRALIIAAAGGHNLLFFGPPGTGKSMLASRLPGLLPVMSRAEALEVASIRSVARFNFEASSWGARPFRAPHHTASAVALVGGGNPPMPGEISLAHQGVLFLDELPEYPRHVLEVLREPLESGLIVISRAHHQVTYPARFQLVAAMNPCPCGFYGDNTGRCECRSDQIDRYKAKISGPLLDRIDLQVQVPPLPRGALTSTLPTSTAEHGSAMRDIGVARAAMAARSGSLNAHLGAPDIQRYCQLEQRDQRMLEDAMEKLCLSARAYFKILKLARTIADLAGEGEDMRLATPHLTEALAFRRLPGFTRQS